MKYKIKDKLFLIFTLPTKMMILLLLLLILANVSCSQDQKNNSNNSEDQIKKTSDGKLSTSKDAITKTSPKNFSYSISSKNSNIYKTSKLKTVIATLKGTPQLVEILEETKKEKTTSENSQKSLYKVKTQFNKIGYTKKENLLTKKWIKIWKKEHKLFLMEGENKVLLEYPVAFGFNPTDDKIEQGDGCTPEGRFYICEMLDDPEPKSSYGARSMRISYPNLEDARRGLRDKKITKKQYLSIMKSINNLEMPSQKTKLGSSIRIHGGGVGEDWTLGCIAMRDKDIKVLFSALPKKNALVEIYHDKKQDLDLNNPNFVSKAILSSSKKLFKNKILYTNEAAALIPLTYPFGDFKKSIGVCTDIIIRALRPSLGVDLQSLLHEDILLNPARYKKEPNNIKKANSNIDHRRTRNLKTWLDHYAIKLSNKVPKTKKDSKILKDWKAGDIVLMDTGVDNGTIYDHIGIVSDTMVEGNIRPAVINLWTTGYELEEMDLLDGEYPLIVGHYRLTHPFNYNTIVPAK